MDTLILITLICIVVVLVGLLIYIQVRLRAINKASDDLSKLFISTLETLSSFFERRVVHSEAESLDRDLEIVKNVRSAVEELKGARNAARKDRSEQPRGGTLDGSEADSAPSP